MKNLAAAFLLLLFIVPAFAQDTKAPQVLVTRNVIKHSTPGEYEVTITISCLGGEVKGYARYKEIISEKNKNTIASEIKNGGASFTSNNNEIKFIWTGVSLKQPLVISYLIKDADEINAGLAGTFTFVYNEKPLAVKLEERNMTGGN